MSIRKVSDTPKDCPEIWRADSDINGNSRYVVSYLAIPFTDYETGGEYASFYSHQLAHIEHARRALHGKKYRAKWYGGGIVFQAYAGDPIQHVLDSIERGEIAA